jgi:hypothetical protein
LDNGKAPALNEPVDVNYLADGFSNPFSNCIWYNPAGRLVEKHFDERQEHSAGFALHRGRDGAGQVI